MSGQVWISLDENGLEGILKGILLWSDDLHSPLGTLFKRTRVAAQPALKPQTGVDGGPAQDQEFLPVTAADEDCDIVVKSEDGGQH